jgi:pSer/pThr/pTyr-binding forkhead associated (FHA) protein
MNPPHIVVQLIHIHGGLKGEIREFDGNEITIGRLPSCSVKFPADEPGVSREHATIVRDGNQFKLTDRSRFGTFVNGKQVKTAYLRSGDVIEFGPGGPKASFTMEVLVSPTAHAAATERRPPPAAAPQPPPSPPAALAPPIDPLFSSPPTSAGAKTLAPLVIQLGPTIRAYRELPVVIGADQNADFILKLPGIRGTHARILFHANAYWIEDLTGESLVRINLAAVGGAVRLNPQDRIECTPQGPVFRFLGEGRLAEVDDFTEEAAAPQFPDSPPSPASTSRDAGSFLGNLVRGLKGPGNRS